MIFLDLLFPKTCLGCDKKGKYFCPSCASKIKLIEKQICPVCEHFSFFGQTHHFCQMKWSLDGLISLFTYEGIVRKAIHQLKFKYVTDLTEELFQIINDSLDKSDHFSLMKRFILDKKPTVIPVPLFWYKENYRGFNQAEIFGKKLAQNWGLEFKKDILIRSKFTQPQFGLDKKERKKNIENAFSVSPNILISLYPNILLVDDIWTTGATLKACGSLLKRAGVKEVWGLTLAR